MACLGDGIGNGANRCHGEHGPQSCGYAGSEFFRSCGWPGVLLNPGEQVMNCNVDEDGEQTESDGPHLSGIPSVEFSEKATGASVLACYA